MINFKQKELVDEIYNEVKNSFTEINLIDVSESPEDPNDLWINITAPNDEDREIELRELASELSTEALINYGYSILVMPL